MRRRCVAARVGPVVVATDTPALAELVASHGGEVVLTGPHPTGTHRVAAVAATLAAARIINVQGDMPLVEPEHVVAVAAALHAGHGLVTVAARSARVHSDDPAVVRVQGGGGPVVFARTPPPPGVTAGVHVGIYGFAADVLARVAALPADRDLEQRAWLAAGIPIHLVWCDHAPPSVDTPHQLEALRARFDSGELVIPPAPGQACAPSRGSRV